MFLDRINWPEYSFCQPFQLSPEPSSCSFLTYFSKWQAASYGARKTTGNLWDDSVRLGIKKQNGRESWAGVSSFKVTLMKWCVCVFCVCMCVRCVVCVCVCMHPFLVASFPFQRLPLGCFPILTSVRYPDSSDGNVGHFESLGLKKLKSTITKIFRGQFLKDLPCMWSCDSKDSQHVGHVFNFNVVSTCDCLFFNPSTFEIHKHRVKSCLMDVMVTDDFSGDTL